MFLCQSLSKKKENSSKTFYYTVLSIIMDILKILFFVLLTTAAVHVDLNLALAPPSCFPGIKAAFRAAVDGPGRRFKGVVQPSKGLGTVCFVVTAHQLMEPQIMIVSFSTSS